MTTPWSGRPPERGRGPTTPLIVPLLSALAVVGVVVALFVWLSSTDEDDPLPGAVIEQPVDEQEPDASPSTRPDTVPNGRRNEPLRLRARADRARDGRGR